MSKSRKIVIETCSACPFYKEENNVMRDTLGSVSRCTYLDVELEFTDKMNTPKVYDSIHRDCELDFND